MSGLMSERSQTDASWQDYFERLCAYFRDTAQQRCLLWVDPAQADPFQGSDLVDQGRVRVPIRHPRFDPVRAPYLVPLDLSCSGDADLFSNSVELAWLSWSREYLAAMQGQAICGWVRTGASAKTLARHWGMNCHLHTARRLNRLLRFQDPGVREWLWPVLDKTQQQAMLGPALEIVSIGRTRQLIHHGRPESTQHSSSSNDGALDSFSRLRIEQRQWDQIDDYAVLHGAWLRWLSSSTDETSAVQEAGWERAILRTLAQASSLGIRDAADRELFALHALQLGPDFLRSSKLDEIWPKTRAGEFYGSAVESVLGCAADQLHLS